MPQQQNRVLRLRRANFESTHFHLSLTRFAVAWAFYLGFKDFANRPIAPCVIYLSIRLLPPIFDSVQTIVIYWYVQEE